MKKKYLKVLEDKFWFRVAFRKKIELGMSVHLALALYRDLLLFTVYGFLKWEMIWGNGFMAISCFILVVAFIQTFQCSLEKLFE